MNPAAPTRPVRRGILARGDLVVLLLIAAIGLVDLLQPFTWDQAMFTLGARRLHEGGVLYRDHWEVKPPGIYLFYYLAGSLFGFSEIGVHLLELLYLLGGCVVLLYALRDWFDHPWAARAALLLTVGLYYAVAGDWHLTQVESLVGLPAFLALWWGVRGTAGERGASRDLFLSGVGGGCVLLLKLVFLPVVAGFWLVDLVAIARRAGGARGNAIASSATAILLGVLLPLGAAAIYLAAHRTLGLAIALTIEYPARLVGRVHEFRSIPFEDGLGWFVHRWSPLLGLGLIGVWPSFRRRNDLIAPQLLLWLGAGFAVILVQRASFWQYHYMLFVVPLGVLAARGIDVLWPGVKSLAPARSARGIAIAAILATLALFSGPLGELARKAGILAKDRFGLTPEGRSQYRRTMSRYGAYAAYASETAFLSSAGARPGPIFVVGDPLYYWIARREPALPRGAWFAEYLTAEEWSGLARDLARARPPYVFVEREHSWILAACRPRSDAFLAELARDYRRMPSGRRGDWYELRPGRAPAR